MSCKPHLPYPVSSCPPICQSYNSPPENIPLLIKFRGGVRVSFLFQHHHKGIQTGWLPCQLSLSIPQAPQTRTKHDAGSLSLAPLIPTFFPSCPNSTLPLYPRVFSHFVNKCALSVHCVSELRTLLSVESKDLKQEFGSHLSQNTITTKNCLVDQNLLKLLNLLLHSDLYFLIKSSFRSWYIAYQVTLLPAVLESHIGISQSPKCMHGIYLDWG